MFSTKIRDDTISDYKRYLKEIQKHITENTHIIKEVCVIISLYLLKKSTINVTRNGLLANRFDGKFCTLTGKGMSCIPGLDTYVSKSRYTVHSVFTCPTDWMFNDTFAVVLSCRRTVLTGGNLKRPLQIFRIPQSIHSDIKSICLNGFAFAATLNDGSLVTWGKQCYGGNSKKVQKYIVPKGSLRVLSVAATQTSFCAILDNGSVIAWGDKKCGGSLPIFSSHTSPIRYVYSTDSAFAALDSKGYLTTWGHCKYGGDFPVSLKKKRFVNVKSTEGSFCAVTVEGEIFSWGNLYSGGRGVNPSLIPTDVPLKKVYASTGIFAAHFSNLLLVCWGAFWGNGKVEHGVKKVFVGTSGFFLLKKDNSVVVLGHSRLFRKRIERVIETYLSHGHTVCKIIATHSLCTILFDDGTVWSTGVFRSGTEEEEIYRTRLFNGIFRDVYLNTQSMDAWNETR